MKAARADRSGVFDQVTLSLAKAPVLVRPTNFRLSPRGLTFRSATQLASWTEVDIELETPFDAKAKRRGIRCSGVVVDCRPDGTKNGYDVTLLFTDLNKRAAADLEKLSKLQASISLPRVAALHSARV